MLLVALVISAAAAATAGARPQEIAGAVRHEIVRALCVVRRGDCDRDQEACTMSSDSKRAGVSLGVSVFRIGRHHSLVREERSDGTVALTLVEEHEGGAEIATGARLRVALGRRALTVGGEAGASALVASGSGRTWVVPEGAAANALADDLRVRFATAPARALAGGLVDGLLGDLPAPTSTFDDTGLDVSATASAARGSAVAEAGFSAEDVWGSRVERTSGRRTLYIRRTNELAGSLGTQRAGARGAAGREVEYAVTIEPDGRAVDLAIIEGGSLDGSVDLPARLQPIAGALNASAPGARAWVAESHLDLTDPGNLAVARDVVAQLRNRGPRLGNLVDVSRALEERLASRGVIHARTYAVDDTAIGVDARGGIGAVRGSLEVGGGTESSRLVAASTRGIDGEWRVRDDCRAAGSA